MGKVVLIVEDNAVFRRGLERLVAVEGFEPLSFASGEAALDGLRTNDFDMALLDIRLPGMGGDDLGAILMQRCATKPIAFVTSEFTCEHRLVVRMPGCRVIMKPADVKTIIDFLHEEPGGRAALKA